MLSSPPPPPRLYYPHDFGSSYVHHPCTVFRSYPGSCKPRIASAFRNGGQKICILLHFSHSRAEMLLLVKKRVCSFLLWDLKHTPQKTALQPHPMPKRASPPKLKDKFVWRPKQFKEERFSQAQQFTTNLASIIFATVLGYSQ